MLLTLTVDENIAVKCQVSDYVRPVRRIGTENRSGPVRSAVSDRSRADLGPDRSDEKFSDGAKFSKKKFGATRLICQKIVEIGAILAIFESFEVRKFRMPLFGEFSRSFQDLYRNPLQIELSLGRLSKFFEKWWEAF